MRIRSVVTALICGSVTGGLSWLSLQPVIGTVLALAREVPIGERAAATVRASSAMLGLLDVALASALAYLAIRFLIERPVRDVERAVEPLLEREGLRLVPSQGLARSLGRGIELLVQVLDAERRTSARRLAELTANVEQRTRLQAELVAADRLATVGKLAAGVAHEVGNPLSGILGYLSVLRMRAGQAPGPIPDANSMEVIDRIEAEVHRIDAIVRSLLEMGRPSRGKAQPHEVRPIIESCLRMVAASAGASRLQTEVVCAPSLYLRFEPGPLSQVLVNLVINAAQATEWRGRVVVNAEVRDGQGVIVVEDDGPGIPLEVLPRLFSPFFTTKPAGQGSGLGLAVSRHLLSQFEGRLDAGNRPVGNGARFTITLPVT
jgi:two-component system, NtrC family, sensor kinase